MALNAGKNCEASKKHSRLSFKWKLEQAIFTKKMLIKLEIKWQLPPFLTCFNTCIIVNLTKHILNIHTHLLSKI